MPDNRPRRAMPGPGSQFKEPAARFRSGENGQKRAHLRFGDHAETKSIGFAKDGVECGVDRFDEDRPNTPPLPTSGAMTLHLLRDVRDAPLAAEWHDVSRTNTSMND